MKQCPKCNSYMKFNMEYFCGNPFIYYNCISCGYDEREHHKYYISTTKTDSYFENRLSELKNEYDGVNDAEPISISMEKELRTDYQKFSSKLKELEKLKTTEDYDNANLNLMVKEIYKQDNEAMNDVINVLKSHLDLINRMAKIKGINLNEE